MPIDYIIYLATIRNSFLLKSEFSSVHTAGLIGYNNNIQITSQ